MEGDKLIIGTSNWLSSGHGTAGNESGKSGHADNNLWLGRIQAELSCWPAQQQAGREANDVGSIISLADGTSQRRRHSRIQELLAVRFQFGPQSLSSSPMVV